MSDLENKKNPVVITIARDFGAEGHEIGRMLADELGIPLYDNELLVRASLRTGESLDKMAAYDERLAVENMAFLPDRYDARSYSDKLFQKMSPGDLGPGRDRELHYRGSSVRLSAAQ